MDKEFALLHLAYVRKHKEEIKHITNEYSLWYKKIKADRIKESQEEAAWYWDALTTGYLPHLTTYIACKAKGIFISDNDDKSALEHTGEQLESHEIELARRASKNARKLHIESELYQLMSAWHSLATQPMDLGGRPRIAVEHKFQRSEINFLGNSCE